MRNGPPLVGRAGEGELTVVGRAAIGTGALGGTVTGPAAGAAGGGILTRGRGGGGGGSGGREKRRGGGGTGGAEAVERAQPDRRKPDAEAGQSSALVAALLTEGAPPP